MIQINRAESSDINLNYCFCLLTKVFYLQSNLIPPRGLPRGFYFNCFITFLLKPS